MKKKKPVRRNWKKRPGKNQRIRFWLSLIGLLVFFLPDQASGQSTEYPFANGEYARYGAYYNWNFIWIQSGEVEFRTDTVNYKQQKAWHLEALGKSLKTFDLLYSVRDTFETYCNYSSFLPIYSSRVMNHSKEYSLHQYIFDYSSGKIDVRVKQGEKTLFRTSLPIQNNTFDLLATAYNFRKFDFNKLFIGEKVPYRMLIDKQVADLFFRYLGKENVKTRKGKIYRCHKVSVYLLQGDFFPEGEYMKIWFTDDKNHLPVQVETEVLLGSVKALLQETKSMKYPLTSEIK